MDEKYIELRGKLDWTRTHSQKEVKRARKEADRVREKWMMAESMGFVYGDLDSDGKRGQLRSLIISMNHHAYYPCSPQPLRAQDDCCSNQDQEGA